MIVFCCSPFRRLNLVEMFKYFPDLNDLSIAMGTMDKVAVNPSKTESTMDVYVLIFFIDKTLSTLLWLCLTLVFENEAIRL